MPALLDDDFSSYAIGAGLPLGSWHGSGNVVNFGDVPGNRSIQLGDMYAYTALTPSPVVYWTSLIPADGGAVQGSVLELWSGNPITGLGAVFLGSLNIELNNTLSLITTSGRYMVDPISGLYANSGIQTANALYPGNYQFFRMFTMLTVNTLGTIEIGVNCFVENEQWLSGSADTGINPAGSPVGCAANLFVLKGMSLRGGYLGNVTIWDNTTGDAPQYPHPSFPPTVVNALASELVIETVVRPTDAKARASEMVLELLSRPTDAKARVSQMVIELIYGAAVPPPPPSSGVFPEYIRCRRSV